MQHDASPDTSVYRLARGRRRYNQWRQRRAGRRRAQLRPYMPALLLQHGLQTRLARELGVHRSTICRDAQRLWEDFCGGRWTEEAARAT